MPRAALASGPEPPASLDWHRSSASCARVSMFSAAALTPPTPALSASAAAAMICDTAAESPTATEPWAMATIGPSVSPVRRSGGWMKRLPAGLVTSVTAPYVS